MPEETNDLFTGAMGEFMAQGAGVIPPGYEDIYQQSIDEQRGEPPSEGIEMPLPEETYEQPDPDAEPHPNQMEILPEESYRGSSSADTDLWMAAIPEELEPQPSGDVPPDSEETEPFDPYPEEEQFDTDDPFSGEIN
ncbi:hypothetical protein [Gloeobacter violaceus]|nr:hypothetical protein [Gloeobacter violaceus]